MASQKTRWAFEGQTVEFGVNLVVFKTMCFVHVCCYCPSGLESSVCSQYFWYTS